MKKIVIAPDSFKGTLSAAEVCDIIETGLSEKVPDGRFVTVPVADGGEGTVDSLLRAMDGEKVYLNVRDAFGDKIRGFYGRFGDLAAVEMAAVAGMVSNSRRDPITASTYGVGQLIEHAVSDGCSEILLGLGGSCTNDAGAGMAAAMGTLFSDSEGKTFVPAGGTLHKVCDIDNSMTEQKLEGITVKCICDINLKLYGEKGAAYVFAPQKGASPEQVKELDYNLRCFAEMIKATLNKDVSDLEGGAAAGGMGAGASAFFGAGLCKGIELILDLIHFDDLLDGCDLVVTGEGRLDSQSASGKVVSGVIARAKRKNIPVAVIAGSAGDDADMSELGFDHLYITAPSDVSFDIIKKDACKNLLAASRRLGEDIIACQG